MDTIQNRLHQQILPKERNPGSAQTKLSASSGKKFGSDYVTDSTPWGAMTDYPEVALIEAFKDGMLPSLKQMIMVTRDTLPDTLKEWQDLGSTPRSEQKNQRL